jgi:DNA-binding MurR/RpiR family transcriptional regulator
MDDQSINILDRIHASYYQLSAAERKVADYVLIHHDQVQFMSITQLADECGIAEATVSRFCRSLKLKGFNAFKIELAKHSVSSGAARMSSHGTDTLTGRCQEVGRLAGEAVNHTIEMVDPKQVQQAVEMFEKAPHVMCIGSGGSMIMASTFANMFAMADPKFYAVADSHTQISSAATMGKGDMIVLFSYSGATTSGVQVLELARSRGIPTVLITRYPKSPAAKLADVVLRCGSNEGPFQFGSVPAKIAQLVVMDVLFQEYCHRNRSRCEDNIQRIAAALSDKHL